MEESFLDSDGRVSLAVSLFLALCLPSVVGDLKLFSSKFWNDLISFCLKTGKSDRTRGCLQGFHFFSGVLLPEVFKVLAELFVSLLLFLETFW